MGDWHRDHPELAGTNADPWMIHPGYRRQYQGLDDTDLNRLRDMRPDVEDEDADDNSDTGC